MSDLNDDGFCFGCGPDNPIGLKLTFAWEGDRCIAHWTPLPVHQGWAGRVHGGLLALLLDEALSRVALERHGLHWVTAELTTRLRTPAFTGEALRVEAYATKTASRLILCTGSIETEDTRRIVATGRAKLMRVQI